MRTRPTTRRSIALLATTALMTGGLATGMLATPAFAALPLPEITSVNPTSWDNRSSVNITVHGNNLAPNDSIILVPGCSTDPASPAGTCVPLTGPEVGPITVATTPANYVPACPVATGTCGPQASITGTFNLGQAAPGDYRVLVKHAAPDNGTSNPFSYFWIVSYGGANATSSQTGVGASGVDPFFGGVDCDVTNNGCGRDNGLPNGIPLDVHGANIAIGAKLRFLLPNGSEDTGLEFRPGNPSNGANKFGGNSNGVEGTDATAGTAYLSAAVIQGMYRYYTDSSTTGHVPFTPGLHTIQLLNTDGDATGSQSRFVQPYFAGAADVSPHALGRGAQNVQVTVNGKGFWPGARLAPGCGTSGTAVLSNPHGDGTYDTITAPVSIAGNAASGLCRLSVVNTDGAVFGLPVLSIGLPPHVTAISPSDTSYAHLGQGARVGCEAGSGAGVVITGTNFVDNNPSTALVKDPALMTKFDFGPDITVVTRNVGPTSAAVCIDVDPRAATGRRDVRAINPDGGSTTTTQPVICSDPVAQVDCQPDPRYSDIPLQINAGPRITSVTPSSFAQGATAVPVEVDGTGFHTTIADSQVDISPTGIAHNKTVATATKVTFEASVAPNATAGPRTLTITNPEDYGRAVCTDCLSIDSLQVAPTGATNTQAAQPLALNVTTPGLPPITSSSKVTLTHQTPLPGQPVITANPVAAGADAAHGSATVDLRNAAVGKYNVTVVLDPANGDLAKTVSCAGCFTVTGTALTLDSTTPVSPAKAGQGATNWKLVFKGTGFTNGMQVQIPDVTTDSVSFVSPNEIWAFVDVAPDAATGKKSATATSPAIPPTITAGDGAKATFDFEVTPAPVAKSVTAGAAYGQGAGTAGSPDTTSATPPVSTLPITVTGSGFDDTADTQVVLGPDVSVVDEVVTKGTAPTCAPAVPPLPPVCQGGTDDSVTGKAAVSATATTGKRALQLDNPADGGTATLADAFTVNPGPTFSSVANENGQAVLVRDGLKHTVSFVGSAFPTPTTDADKAAAFKITNLDGSAIDPSAIKVENVQFTASKITADITAFASRAYGPVRIAVYDTTDKGFGTCSTCLSVADLPDPVSFSLTSGAGSLTAAWVAPAANGSAIAGYKLTILAPGSATPTVVALPASSQSYTFGNLVNGATYTVGVAAVNGAGTGPSTTKTGIAGLPSALSIRVSPTAVTYGQAYYVTGKLTSNGVGVGGKTLILTFVPSIGKAYARTVTTVASGTTRGVFTYKTSSPYTVRVKAQLVPNDPTYRPVSTAYVTETVKVRILKSGPVNGSRSSYTTTLKITGTVAPNKRGRSAYLYRYINRRNVLLQRVTISSTSTYAFAVKPGKGTYLLHVYVPATPGNAANYSGWFTLYRV